MPALAIFVVVAVLLGDTCFVSAGSTSGKEFIFSTIEEVDLDLTSVDADTSKCDVVQNGVLAEVTVGRLPTEKAVNGTVKISCTAAISAIIRATNTTSWALPADVLDTKYVVPAQELVLTATRNATEVNLNCSGSSKLQLGEGESKHVTGCAVGTEINSTEPISMMAAKGSISIPPVKVWGKEYVLGKLPPGQSYLVVVANGDAVCKQNGSKVDMSSLGSGQLECEQAAMVATKQGDELVSLVYSTTQCSNSVTVATNKSSPGSQLIIELRKKFANDELLINGKMADGAERVDVVDIGDFTRLSYQAEADVLKVTHRNPTAKICAWVVDKDGLRVSLSPLSLPATGEYCERSSAMANDGLDNDCDYQVDEELLNGEDDDGDGQIDEDTATNEHYGDLRDNSGSWPLSYTVIIIVLLVILLLILIAVCHWQCAKFKPEVKDIDDDLMVASYNSRAGSIPARYSLSGSRSGFTISRR